MPVDQAPSRPNARQSDAAKLIRYDDYIDAKIQSTRQMVKVVDLATALVTLATSLLAFLFLAVLAEHWLVPGGFSFAGRLALFLLLLAGIGYFAFRRLWPLFARAINPIYAAQTIEQDSPLLKNSLINLLLFRQRRSEISDAVYRTLEEQAAQGLSRVPVDTAVDRSQLIRLGYALIAVVAVTALYKVLSPKDPLVSAERVLMPWADIVPASRVSITAIKPGMMTVSRGEFVDVSAEIRGLNGDDEALLRYTTDDGQTVDKSIPLKLSSDGLRFGCRISDEADGTGSVGLTRNLTYRIEAGDARSLEYGISVVPTASILVERVEYDFPAYTGYVDRSVNGIGDLRAIEGTRVTIHARANGPIREADVDFDADGRRDLHMTATESEARAGFELALRDDRQTPRHASYVLRFTNSEGRANRDPVKHSINVERDYEPEAEIRRPQEKALDVRLDEQVAVEVEARDPDFALSAVRLRGEVAGHVVLDEPLLKSEHRGRFAGRYVLTPSAHELKAGDVLEYWVETADNRAPKPNSTATERKVLRVLSPIPAQQPPPNQIAQNDRKQPQPGERQPGEGRQGKGERGEGKRDGNAGRQQPGAEGGPGQEGGAKRDQQNQNAEKQPGSSQAGKSDAENKPQPNTGDEKQPNEADKNSEGSDQGDNKGQPGGQGQAGQQSKTGDSKSDQPKSNGEQTGAGAAGRESSKGDTQSDGARQTAQPGAGSAQPEANKGEGPPTGEPRNGNQQSKPDEKQAPVSSEGDNDAEAFDRIQQHLERKGELKGDDASPPAAGETQVDKEKRRQGESEGKSQESDKQTTEPGGEFASADGKPGAETKNAEQQQQQPGSKSKEQSDGTGAETRGDDLKDSKEKSDGQLNQEKSPGGQQTASKGPAGAGDEQKSQGAPNSQPEMKPKEKRQQAPSNVDEKSNQQEPPAGANGKRESDSQGEQGGDKAGGGEEGGGQKAPRQGTGSAGQNQSTDNGAGESGEQGKGDNSPNAGRDAKSDHRTGSSDGKTPGEGSKQQDGKGDKAGGKAGGGDAPARSNEGGSEKDSDLNQEQPSKGDAKPGQGDKQSGKQGDKQAANQEQKSAAKQDQKAEKPAAKRGDKDAGKQGESDADKGQEGDNNSNSGGASGGAGQPGGAADQTPSITGETPEGDAANLEYARKQTDLVLEKLADQLNRKKVDERLLKELGWSEADMRRFVERWQQRRAAAEKIDPSGEAAKRELDEALRSLGLRPGTLQQDTAKKDTLRDLREGYRGPVPSAYQERLRAYNQGVSRARQDGE